jgi:hypothetical protein
LNQPKASMVRKGGCPLLKNSECLYSFWGELKILTVLFDRILDRKPGVLDPAGKERGKPPARLGQQDGSQAPQGDNQQTAQADQGDDDLSHVYLR